MSFEEYSDGCLSKNACLNFLVKEVWVAQVYYSKKNIDCLSGSRKLLSCSQLVSYISEDLKKDILVQDFDRISKIKHDHYDSLILKMYPLQVLKSDEIDLDRISTTNEKVSRFYGRVGKLLTLSIALSLFAYLKIDIDMQFVSIKFGNLDALSSLLVVSNTFLFGTLISSNVYREYRDALKRQIIFSRYPPHFWSLKTEEDSYRVGFFGFANDFQNYQFEQQKSIDWIEHAQGVSILALVVLYLFLTFALAIEPFSSQDNAVISDIIVFGFAVIVHVIIAISIYYNNAAFNNSELHTVDQRVLDFLNESKNDLSSEKFEDLCRETELSLKRFKH